jgi:hypothetical protein
MPEDQWGHPHIYPSKSGGFTYEQSNNILDDDHFNGEGDVTEESNGEWTFETDGPTSVQIFKNSDSAQSIGGCDMDFGDTVTRGYGYKSDDPRDIEITLEIKFQEAGSDNGFAIEGPTGRHSGDGCCQGFAYKIDIQFQEDPTKFRFRKEMWHVSNHNDPKTGEFTSPDFDFLLLGHSDWVGFKYIHYVKKDGASSGHNTKDSVVLELWGNPDPDSDKQNWKLLKRTEDRGGWGNDGDQCNGDDDQIGAWSNSNFRLKSNTEGGQFRLRRLSLREIDPTKDFDDSPDDPGTNPPSEQPGTTRTVQGIFKLQRDINSIRSNPCSLTGDKSFFNWISDADEHNLADADVSDSIKRLGQRAANINSSLVGKVPSKFDVKLRKVGTPGASPTVNATIRTSSNVLKYTSPTAVDPSSLTTSLATTTFDFSTNTYALQTGDKICVEYEGTSDSNYVRAGVRDNNDASEADGTNSTLTYFDGDWHNSASRDLACTIYEDA